MLDEFTAVRFVGVFQPLPFAIDIHRSSAPLPPARQLANAIRSFVGSVTKMGLAPDSLAPASPSAEAIGAGSAVGVSQPSVQSPLLPCVAL